MDPRATASEFSRIPGRQHKDRRDELADAYSTWVAKNGFLAKTKVGDLELSILGLIDRNSFPYFWLSNGTSILAVGQQVL